MKKAILKTSGTLLVVGLALTAMLFGCRHKAEQQTEPVNLTIFKTDGHGKITGYNCPKDELPKNLVIPARIRNKVITSIGESAFIGCDGLTSVSFPASLTSIGDSAFKDCKGLTSVSLSGCTSLTSIGDYAFERCYGLTSVSFPASLTSIGFNAFQWCDKLTSATFADATGWAVYNDNKYKNKAADIQQSDLQNAATAANYLRNYHNEWWKKN